jgi:hypothetical protein
MVIFRAKNGRISVTKKTRLDKTNAKNDVKLEYFKRGNFPAQRPGKESVTGSLT